MTDIVVQLRDLGREQIADEVERLRAELTICRNIRSEAVARLMDAAAFLDALAARTVDFPGVVSDEGNELLIRVAADCRAMARRLRGEP